ncbi:tripartite tricarboxylate transporter TctB family protein [Azospirillum thermophilum]|uniref:Tripartite tricarboxylate transporter TctB family protein n=1 Tax=Azospirillum thermophilum TaxID=2202148 RepID=A0A2S2CXY3_9PROT|nr:tripartite tricarboxylate transporter TctB family protein [Azospirillum thermophilum]AWK89373.1 tripartite tricarboxylate transporter TctB family protein [Azospirillum thermophilum]
MSQAPGGQDAGSGFSRTDRLANLIIAAVVIAIAIAAIVATGDFPATSLATDVGPARFPIIYSVALIVLSGILILHTLRKQVVDSLAAGDPAARMAGRINVALGIGASVLCLVAIGYIGFAIATVLYLSTIMWLMGQRGLVLNPIIAVAVTAIIYVTFSTGLQVPLPVGSLFE